MLLVQLDTIHRGDQRRDPRSDSSLSGRWLQHQMGRGDVGDLDELIDDWAWRREELLHSPFRDHRLLGAEPGHDQGGITGKQMGLLSPVPLPAGRFERPVDLGVRRPVKLAGDPQGVSVRDRRFEYVEDVGVRSHDWPSARTGARVSQRTAALPSLPQRSSMTPRSSIDTCEARGQ